MSVAADADTYHNDTALLGRQTIATLLRLWGTVDAGDITGSWGRLVPQALAVLAGAETVAAEFADPYIAQVADDTSPPRVSVDGMVRSGLEDLLYMPTIRAKTLIGQGMAASAAMLRAGHALGLYAQTRVADTARLAVTAGMTARPHIGGYYRKLRPPSCSRCAILAGRWYRWNAGFDRHPRCFPEGVAVSGPAALAATRRWYEGELVVLSTASGQELSLTGNHPVLTRCGWMPANRLQEGDEVLRSARPQGATPLVVPDHHQVPALIEDVWRAFSVSGLERMPTAAEDFHGDGGHGEVDVVWADRALRHAMQAVLSEQSRECGFAFGFGGADGFFGERAAKLLDVGQPPHAGGAVGGSGLPLTLLGCHLGGAVDAGRAGPASRYPRFAQASSDDSSRYAVFGGESVLAGAIEIGGGDGLDGENLGSPRWDAPGGAFSVETAEGYAARGRDLLDRLASQVELDRVVELRRVQWSGHVYSLTSSEGWHTANSLIVSNCDCVHIPVREADDSLAYDPRGAIEAGMVTGLSKKELEAIRLGADPSQVVNARSGMYTAGEFQFTRTGTTRRGVAGARILAKDIDRALGVDVSANTYTNYTFDRLEAAKYAELFRRGKTFTRLTRRGRVQKYSYRFVRTPRPSPSQIITSASSRDEAIRLLTNYGYLL